MKPSSSVDRQVGAAADAPSAAAAATLRIEQRGAVAWLWLDQPGRMNPLSLATLDALDRTLRELAGQAQTRVVVLAADGPAFCAGHDLREMMAEPDPLAHQALFDRCSQVMLRIGRLPQPVIARVQGLATAAGCQLVAACDLAVASETARFAVSGVNLGLFCATPSVALSRNLSRKRAFEMLVTGDFIDAAVAEQWGLVNQVVVAAELDAAVTALAERIATKAPVALQMGKQLFYRQLEMGVEAAYQLAGRTMSLNLQHDAARQGIGAFLDRPSGRKS